MSELGPPAFVLARTRYSTGSGCVDEREEGAASQLSEVTGLLRAGQ